jgi:hypothetical protein
MRSVSMLRFLSSSSSSSSIHSCMPSCEAHHDNRASRYPAVLLLPGQHILCLQVVTSILSHLVCSNTRCRAATCSQYRLCNTLVLLS